MRSSPRSRTRTARLEHPPDRAMIPQTFGESLRRVRHRFVRRATLVRSLPASTRRGSRTLARTSWVRCSTLRFRTRPPHLALSTLHSALGAPHSALGAPHSALGPQPSALSPRPSALGPRPSALGPQPWALGPRPSALSRQPSALSRQPSALSRQPSALGPQPSAVGPQPSAVGPRPSALSPRPSALGTRHSALSTQHSALSFGPRPRPSHNRTVRPAETFRNPFVSSDRPRTAQPRSRGPVRTHSSGAPMIPRTFAPRVASRPNAGRKDVPNTRIPAHGDLEPPT